MLTGISTACFYPMETERAVQSIIQLGFDAIEVFANCMTETSFDYIRDLRRICDDNGIRVISFHPFTSFIEPYYFFSDYKRRTYEGIDLYKRQFECAARLGAGVVNFHGAKKEQDVDIDLLLEMYSRLYQAAKEQGVIFAQENVSRCKSASPDFIKIMRNSLKEECAFTLDIKQANRAGISPVEMLEVMGDKVVNLHINDYDSERDCLLPGEGSFDFRAFYKKLKTIKYKGDAIIEVYKSSYKCDNDILESKRFINRLFF